MTERVLEVKGGSEDGLRGLLSVEVADNGRVAGCAARILCLEACDLLGRPPVLEHAPRGRGNGFAGHHWGALGGVPCRVQRRVARSTQQPGHLRELPAPCPEPAQHRHTTPLGRLTRTREHPGVPAPRHQHARDYGHDESTASQRSALTHTSGVRSSRSVPGAHVAGTTHQPCVVFVADAIWPTECCGCCSVCAALDRTRALSELNGWRDPSAPCSPS